MVFIPQQSHIDWKSSGSIYYVAKLDRGGFILFSVSIPALAKHIRAGGALTHFLSHAAQYG